MTKDAGIIDTAEIKMEQPSSSVVETGDHSDTAETASGTEAKYDATEKQQEGGATSVGDRATPEAEGERASRAKEPNDTDSQETSVGVASSDVGVAGVGVANAKSIYFDEEEEETKRTVKKASSRMTRVGYFIHSTLSGPYLPLT